MSEGGSVTGSRIAEAGFGTDRMYASPLWVTVVVLVCLLAVHAAFLHRGWYDASLLAAGLSAVYATAHARGRKYAWANHEKEGWTWGDL